MTSLYVTSCVIISKWVSLLLLLISFIVLILFSMLYYWHFSTGCKHFFLNNIIYHKTQTTHLVFLPRMHISVAIVK